MRVHSARAIVAAAAFTLGVLGCGGGDGSPTGPTPPGSGPQQPAATITISSSGVSPKTVRIEAGQAIRFVNSDSATHVPSSNPHPTHTDCPGINSAGTLAPGASGTTAALGTSRACGYHDHNNPDDDRFRGQIVVGNAQELPGY